MCFYILNSPRSDKIKIGISSDFSRRFNEYRQHNPDIAIYRVYGCDMKTAKRIETEMKAAYAEYAVKGSTEWLTVDPRIIDKVVISKLEDDIVDDDIVIPQSEDISVSLIEEYIFNLLSGYIDLESLKYSFDQWNSYEIRVNKNCLYKIFVSMHKKIGTNLSEYSLYKFSSAFIRIFNFPKNYNSNWKDKNGRYWKLPKLSEARSMFCEATGFHPSAFPSA